jgi:hypothetical protein
MAIAAHINYRPLIGLMWLIYADFFVSLLSFRSKKISGNQSNQPNQWSIMSNLFQIRRFDFFKSRHFIDVPFMDNLPVVHQEQAWI